MEGNKNNCSTFSVPGTMSDMTVVCTPLPQAASTANKRRSLLETEDRRITTAEKLVEEYDAPIESVSYNPYDCYSHLPPERGDQPSTSNRRTDPSRKCDTDTVDIVNKYLKSHGDSSSDTFKKPFAPVSHKSNVGKNLGSSSDTDSKKTKLSSKFESEAVKILSTPVTHKSSIRNHSNMDIKKNILPSSESKEVNKFPEPIPIKSNSGANSGNKLQNRLSLQSSEIGSFKIPSLPPISSVSQDFLSRSNLCNDSNKLEFPPGLSKYRSTRDLAYENDRDSVTSSLNSSLGVIPSEVLEEASRVPLVDVNQDLSLRLAEKLNLDTSLLKDGMDLSTLASERYKEKLAAKYEDKENEWRNSSGHWTIHGYSSDSSDSKNRTAKRVSSFSANLGEVTETSKKSSLSSRHSSNEWNFTAPQFTPNISLSSDPFGNYSKISVNSEDFQACGDAAQKLEWDEREFSMTSSRSLSGILGDPNASVNVNGEKLSISSFLRGGSYPLGSLETGFLDAQSPQFGLQARSPEKKGKPKPILPPPQDKSTFVVEEEPVRDMPWAPQSLLEQYTSIHNTNTDTDTSVPSFSFIGEMMDRLYQGANPKEIIELMDVHSKTKKNVVRGNMISSVVEGEGSFCQGVEVEQSFAKNKSGLLQSSNAASTAVSICNVTDFEGSEDAFVCVTAPQSLSFDILNELGHPVEYSFAKACYVDGLRNDSAAYVHFPGSELMLYPGEKKTFTVSITPLVAGEIKIKIETTRRNPLTQAREYNYVYGKIIAELPKVSVVTHHKVEMTPSPDCENGKFQHTIVLKNEGRSNVPLKLSLTKIVNEDIEFYIDETEKKTVIKMIEPGQIIRSVVHCVTPPVFKHYASPDTIIPVEAKVEFHLATTDLYQISPVAPVTLTAPLKPYFFGAPRVLDVPGVFSLYNSSSQPVSLKANIVHWYTVHPPSFTIPPNGTHAVSVGIGKSRKPRYGYIPDAVLNLSAYYPKGSWFMSHYAIQLRDDQSSLSANSSLNTPHSSRATSPSSTTDSLPEELQVACSHRQLVWGGCCLHQRVVKSFCIKNKGQLREKLRLTVSGVCFKIVGENDTLTTELKLSLLPMENKEIRLAVLATEVGPQWGYLTISRISQAADKNVLCLYAFGGKSKVTLTEGLVEIGANKYLFLEGNGLQASFTLSNNGNHTAFFRISEAYSKSSTGLVITPHEGLLAASQTLTVHTSLSVTAQRIEYLLRQPVPSVCVAQLSVHWGDESTRQRLLRMRGLDRVVADRVSQLSRIPSSPIINLDKLDCSEISAEELWVEDTEECSVGVFVKRTTLEALRLDVSQVYIDLSKTVSKP